MPKIYDVLGELITQQTGNIKLRLFLMLLVNLNHSKCKKYARILLFAMDNY